MLVPAPSVHFLLTHVHPSQVFFGGCTTPWPLRMIKIGSVGSNVRVNVAMYVASVVPYSG